MSIETRQFRAPIVATSAITEIADGIWVIPDFRPHPAGAEHRDHRRSTGHACD